jgi:hypothetical protein
MSMERNVSQPAPPGGRASQVRYSHTTCPRRKIGNFCELKNCTDGGQAEIINCENIERGAVYDFCETVTINDNSVFTALTPGLFEECVPIESSEEHEQGKGIKGSKKSDPGKLSKFSKSSKSAKRAKSR